MVVWTAVGVVVHGGVVGLGVVSRGRWWGVGCNVVIGRLCRWTAEGGSCCRCWGGGHGFPCTLEM